MGQHQAAIQLSVLRFFIVCGTSGGTNIIVFAELRLFPLTMVWYLGNQIYSTFSRLEYYMKCKIAN